ncbi:MAG: bifunctional folylpolyglutamate synthase/dihydrofolate synthase [Pseudomonadota bacterium]
MDLSLERIRRLLAALGDPQDGLAPTIHVAGTNGKGSTIAILRAILEAAGYRCHVYTSPHLVRFNERIRLAGQLIADGELSRLLEDVERVNGERPITFFEVTTAAALLAFARARADFVLLETGMGGRLDATNLVHPAATALTPISLDHMQHLGDTLAKIAVEKAGILKRGVPVAVGPQPEEAQRVIARRAAEVGAPLFRHGLEWRLSPQRDGFRYHGRRTIDLPSPALPGRHQFDNAGLAIAALETLDGVAISDADLRAGLAGIEWPARLQRLRRGPLAARLGAGSELFLDGGHNEAAGEVLAAWAAAQGGAIDLVFGMLSTKPPEKFLAPLAPHVRALRAVAISSEPLALPAETLASHARAVGIADASWARDVGAAVADLAARGRSRILICGSLYLAGMVLAENG